ncbi:MAG: hypothetical protein QOJ63_3123 [Solirubrobacteraceae bacterium]|jgi:hypothetical protein|nr:hypothetical protein [Solirubrobacteraceae bacterium]
MIRKTIAICLCVLGLGLAAPVAFAQTPSQTGYGETQRIPAPPKPPTTVKTPAKTDKLPFTGMDVGVIVLAALVLVGAGVGLRRMTASREGS